MSLSLPLHTCQTIQVTSHRYWSLSEGLDPPHETKEPGISKEIDEETKQLADVKTELKTQQLELEYAVAAHKPSLLTFLLEKKA